MLRIGIDIGGTFTDFVAWRSAGGETVSFKVPSTPPNYAEGFKAGLTEMLGRVGAGADEDIMIVHGTTVSTNTVIERSAPPIALLTTAGFRDVLNLQRLRLKQPTDIFNQRVPALVPRHLVFEIEERLMADGSVRKPVDLDGVRRAARTAQERGATGFAIAFYHSYRNPDHEQAARAAIREELGDVDVSLSSEIWPQIGEYERAVVAVLNAFVKPKMNSYIADIETFLAKTLPKASLFITRSNGGAMAAAEAREFPVQTLLSGPASGVTAALAVAERLGGGQFLTFDMGGTSTDVSLIRNATATVSSSAEVGDFPLSMPVTEIEAIGAGGGSIISLDGRVLRVGPRSAGARPGPACFGHGGTEPAVSDAYLLCGYLNPENFLGGRMRLDRAAAERAMQPVCDAAGLDRGAAAEAALTVATSNMVARVLPYLARHGVDPEDVTLVVYGGAGSLHGPLLAREMGIGQVLIPPTPSVFCASGGLVTQLVHDTVATVQGQTIDAGVLKAEFADIETRARAWLAGQIAPELLVRVAIARFVDMRYRGQSFQLQVNVPEDVLAAGDLGRLAAAFHAEHDRLYSHSDPGAEVEYLQLRVRISGALPAPGADAAKLRDIPVEQAGSRPIRIGDSWREAPVFDRARLAAGSRIPGPAMIEQDDTTILVPPDFTAVVNDFGDLILSRE
ncbi:hydantoinase/oxoprolinase family protein [Chelatococcus asaccharovorans]|uniref:hydantoinase/oxoprolinase family protein n=1 Tax=Chelatococcus asaccharovorans TaxID=28210 RepID=UPI00224C7789|nr:hydantoinase/oxoprolinase family protein [Chelatococcus asaccharovorans]CAH1654427.1 N-methylhydantoinase A [Chelatococcus asaccharovorans]CAH1690722.1 N-methylhydantoinase A [Chelatococcus asaccharovorans]